jgi:hypothetical protein
MKYTLTFDETVKGWTSFHSYFPDLMLRLNNNFYTVKNGELYKHHVKDIGFNNFYEEQFKSSVTTIINDESSLDKVYKTLVLESTSPLKAELKTNYTESHIKSTEFNKRGSSWYAYIRKNESGTDLNTVSQGLGSIQNITGLDILFTEIPNNVSVGDALFQIRNNEKELIGTITAIIEKTISVGSFTNAPEFNAFCFSLKNARIEGSEMRGYFLEVKLTDDTLMQNEIFGISSEVIQSFL